MSSLTHSTSAPARALRPLYCRRRRRRRRLSSPPISPATAPPLVIFDHVVKELHSGPRREGGREGRLQETLYEVHMGARVRTENASAALLTPASNDRPYVTSKIFSSFPSLRLLHVNFVFFMPEIFHPCGLHVCGSSFRPLQNGYCLDSRRCLLLSYPSPG